MPPTSGMRFRLRSNQVSGNPKLAAYWASVFSSGARVDAHAAAFAYEVLAALLPPG